MKRSAAIDRPRQGAPSAALPDGAEDAANAAFEAIFREYYGPLCGFAERTVGSRAVAEEVVDDVFLRVWEQRERWPKFEGMRAYLYTAVRNQALMHVRHESVVRRVVGDALRGEFVPGMGEVAASADDELHLRRFAKAAQQAIEQLPARNREVYRLYRQHHLSYAEIAEVLGLSVKTVENHLSRSLKSLRASLSLWLR